MEECACDDVYATSFPSQPRLLLAKFVARSRAASKAQSEALEAVSWITPPPAAGGKKFPRQVEHSNQPIENMRLQFRAGGAGRPKHPLHSQSRGKQIAKNRRPRRIGGKEGEKIRRLPVGHAGNN